MGGWGEDGVFQLGRMGCGWDGMQWGNIVVASLTGEDLETMNSDNTYSNCSICLFPLANRLTADACFSFT